jgi:hypothetical protein
MAAPNIVNVSTITGKTAVLAVTTSSSSSIVTNASNSNAVVKINSMIIANIHGSSTYDLNVALFRSSTLFYIASTVAVPSDASLVAISKDANVYLEEGDELRVWSNANSVLHAICSYEIIS